MKNYGFLYIIPFLFLLAGNMHAQSIETFKFKKDPSQVYFFQKGSRRDTIRKNGGDVFYLLVPDSLKKIITLMIDNAQILPTSNDSLVKLKHIRGLKYECFYSKVTGYKSNSVNDDKYVIKNLVNGASDTNKNSVRIQLIDKQKNELLLENVFVYSPEN